MSPSLRSRSIKSSILLAFGLVVVASQLITGLIQYRGQVAAAEVELARLADARLQAVAALAARAVEAGNPLLLGSDAALSLYRNADLLYLKVAGVAPRGGAVPLDYEFLREGGDAALLREEAARGGAALDRERWLYRIERELPGVAGGALVALYDAGELRGLEWRVARRMLLPGAVSLLLALAVAWLVGGRLAAPLATLAGEIAAVSHSFDFSRRMTASGDGEVAETARAVNTLLDQLQGATAAVTAVMGDIARGEFSPRVEAELSGDLAALKGAVNATAATVAAAMQALREVMNALACGNFEVRLGEGVAAGFRQPVNDAMATMQAAVGDLNRVLEGVGRGDLTLRVEAATLGDFELLKERLHFSLEQLAMALAVVARSTQQVAITAVQTSNAVEQVSNSSHSQLGTTAELASAINQSSAAIADVARHTEEASSHAKEAARATLLGREKMGRMNGVVERIAGHSTRITRINDLIGRLASQTNLLALNAAIEAARAGDQGRGFAVVAEEVQKLAESSAESVEEIGEVVEAMVREIEMAVTTAEEVGADLDHTAALVARSDEMLGYIAAAMEEQASAIRELSRSMDKLQAIGRNNASAAEEITASVVELSRLADDTRRRVEQFRLGQPGEG